MSDIKKHYGWSERQLEKAVRDVAGNQNSHQVISEIYNEAYKRKE